MHDLVSYQVNIRFPSDSSAHSSCCGHACLPVVLQHTKLVPPKRLNTLLSQSCGFLSHFLQVSTRHLSHALSGRTPDTHPLWITILLIYDVFFYLALPLFNNVCVLLHLDCLFPSPERSSMRTGNLVLLAQSVFPRKCLAHRRCSVNTN